VFGATPPPVFGPPVPAGVVALVEVEATPEPDPLGRLEGALVVSVDDAVVIFSCGFSLARICRA
jgi:hypothetical protein